ncbi:hypothetical protein M3231_19145 [Neobacillus mesonae]|nr:hypothetical protein [Neobacillus mesonae]
MADSSDNGIDYRTSISDTGSPGVSMSGSAQYEVYVRRSNEHLAAKVINQKIF